MVILAPIRGALFEKRTTAVAISLDIVPPPLSSFLPSSAYVVLLLHTSSWSCDPFFIKQWAAMSSIFSVLSKTAAATSAAASPSSTQRATAQAGILEGSNPSEYDPKNPIFVFIIQVR